MKPIFIAGPHGAGKTTLINNLIRSSTKFIKDDFQIDFTNEMESLSTMTIFEKCLIRLYHRFYTAQRAVEKCKTTKDNTFLIIDRSLYDSKVYIEVEYALGKLTEEQYVKLSEIVDTAIYMLNPYTVILTPNSDEIVDRLDKRRAMGIRKRRDELCAREDNIEYVERMCNEFARFYSNDNVIRVKNNEADDIRLINRWIDQISNFN